MKKFFVCAAVFAAMFFMICCGGDGDKTDSQGEGGIQGSACDKEKEEFNCEENKLFQCKDSKWELFEECEENQKCDAKAGKCGKTEEGNNEENNEGDNTAACGNGVKDEGEKCDSNTVECKYLGANMTGFATCKPDCSDFDTSTCQTSGGNGGNGGGDNGGSGGNGGGSTSGNCAEIMNCFLPANQAQDQAAMQACVNAGSQEGQQAFQTWYNCVSQNQCTQVNCQQCANEYNTCMNGGNGGGNGGGATNTNCGATYNCMASCADGNCQQQCYNNASDTGRAQLDAMLDCFDAACGSVSDAEFSNCANQNCASEIQGCEGLM